MVSGLKHDLKAGEVEMPMALIFTAGPTVPSDGTSGYPKGSLFVSINGTASHTLYLNDGVAGSCTFRRVMTAYP